MRFLAAVLLVGVGMCALAGWAGEGQAWEAVEMATSDGRTATGKLYGSGETAIVLCHGRMYLKGAGSFSKECEALEERGLMCLALNFRGYPGVQPPDLTGNEFDVVAAFDCAVKRGARRVFLLGSSMGGVAVYKALATLKDKPQFAGFVILSAFYPRVTRGVGGRKLFVVAQDDRGIYPKMLATFVEAGAPKQVIVFPKGGHGQKLFEAYRKELIDLIELLTQEYAPAPEAP